MIRWVAGFLSVVTAAAAAAAELAIRPSSGRSVMRRGESWDLAVQFTAPVPVARARLEWWLVEPGTKTRIGIAALGPLPAGPWAGAFPINTGRLRVGKYDVLARLALDEQTEEVATTLEVASDVPLTHFKIHHINLPGWVLPTGRAVEDSRRYHFNFDLANVADSWHRGGAGVGLTGPEQTCEAMVRAGIDYLKYPTVFGWGLAHRPIRGGASWYDPDVIAASQQLTAYHTQACRRFPVFRGLNPIDEPGVSWSDPFMTAAFKTETGWEAPAQEDWQSDLQRYRAYQIFRNHVLNQFHQWMKPYMLAVDPEAVLTCQTFADILTREGLYPAGNVFQDVQCTHIYDHWPSSNNWILFDVNLRRANRRVFWNMPLYAVTGCYGIVEDQWRAAWALGMSEKLDGHGYFVGAGELNEDLPWAEYSLAEMVRINRLNEQYGDFFLALEKPVTPLALWYSLDQAAAAAPARLYEQELVGAFYALKRAHFPVTLVSDEDLRAGLLREHRVLVVVGVANPSDDLKAAIDQFVAGGGQVVADRTTVAGFPGIVALNADFREFAANIAELERAWREKRQPTSMLLRRDLLAEASVLRQLPQIEQVLAPLVDRPARADRPFTLLAEQRHGRARYWFVANDASVYRHPNEGLRWITMQESVPATDTIHLPSARDLTWYDLWTSQRLKPDREGRVELRLPPASLTVLCAYPRPVEEPRLRFTREENHLVVRVEPRAGNSGVIPALLEVRDPGDRVVWQQYAAVDLESRAKNEWPYRLAINDPPGLWTARLTNLLTARRTNADIRIEPPAAQSGIVSQSGPTRVFDARAYAAICQRRPLWIVPGTGCEALAESLREKLSAEVRQASEIRRPDEFPEFLDPEKNKGVWMMTRWQPLALTVGADLILLGSPENNVLIKDLNQSGMLPRVIHPSTLGLGQGLVEYAWSPFDTGKDAVILAGYDRLGLQAAVQRFLSEARLPDSSAKSSDQPLPGDLAKEDLALGEQELPVPTLAPAWRVRLGDGVRAMDARSGVLAVGTEDSRLVVFDGNGRQLWQRDFDYRVIGVAVSADGQYVAASAFPRTYLFDCRGRLLFFNADPEPSLDDTQGLAVSADSLALFRGLWTGQVIKHASDGNRQWVFPAATAEGADPPAPLGPVRSLARLADGRLAVGSMKQLILLDPEGKELNRLAVDRLQQVCAAGERLVVASFKKKLLMLDAQAALVWEQPTPDFIMGTAASADGRTIAAALFGGEVLVFDGDGKLRRRARLPEQATLTAVAVDELGRSLWLATWEGDVLRWDLPAEADSGK